MINKKQKLLTSWVTKENKAQREATVYSTTQWRCEPDTCVNTDENTGDTGDHIQCPDNV